MRRARWGFRRDGLVGIHTGNPRGAAGRFWRLNRMGKDEYRLVKEPIKNEIHSTRFLEKAANHTRDTSVVPTVEMAV